MDVKLLEDDVYFFKRALNDYLNKSYKRKHRSMNIAYIRYLQKINKPMHTYRKVELLYKRNS